MLYIITPSRATTEYHWELVDHLTLITGLLLRSLHLRLYIYITLPYPLREKEKGSKLLRKLSAKNTRDKVGRIPYTS
jgi:hypothetical protein